MLIQDTKDLITKHVSTSIKRSLKHTDARIREHARKRKDILSQWQMDSHALSWNLSRSNEITSYAKLLIILTDDPNNRLTQLVHSSDSWTYTEVASHLIKMAMTPSSPTSAPVVLHGYFSHALPIAIAELQNHAPDDISEQDFVTRIITIMMRKMQIHFLPWHRNASGRGSRPRTVQPDWWMMVNRNTTYQIPQDNNISVEEASALSAATVANQSPAAPWTVPEKLSEMGVFWKKTVLPEDWSLQAASLDNARRTPGHEYVWQTYEYVEQKYDGRHWSHHMALVWAILFSRVAPFLFFKKPDMFARDRDSRLITKDIRKFPWIRSSSQNHRGITAPRPYITMLSTYIIALQDPNSPLSRHTKLHNNSLGLAWTDKHGKPLPKIIYSG